jgi:hypothetical protein
MGDIRVSVLAFKSIRVGFIVIFVAVPGVWRGGELERTVKVWRPWSAKLRKDWGGI